MNLQRFTISHYKTSQNKQYSNLNLSYQIFGQPIGGSPIVLVHHALTGNSDIASEASGWWKTLIGFDKLIDLNRYTVIGIDILGNGYDSSPTLVLNPEDFTIWDIAHLNWQLLDSLNVKSLYACIGGSIGGGIAWEMASKKPTAFQYLIPIASHWKATDWIIGHNYIQNQILKNEDGLEVARMMAMLFYRTPASFDQKFKAETNSDFGFQVNSWLNHHGQTLKSRYKKDSYKMMNHLLSTLNVEKQGKSISDICSSFKGEIIQIGIESDLYFSSEENRKTKAILDQLGIESQYYEIESIHGHDAFLIEYDQLKTFLSPYFNKNKTNENN